MGKNLPAKTKPKNVAHTTKKIKFVGTETFINAKTGEIEEFQVQDIAERDFNFTKVWMRQFVQTLDMLGNQKTKIALWICDNVNRENQIIATYRKIADNTQTSLETVRITMAILQEADFIKKVGHGVYMINADVLFKGTRSNRLNIASIYHELGDDAPKLTDQQKADRLRKSIAELQTQLDLLEKKPQVVDVEVEDQLSIVPDQDGNLHTAQKAK